MIVVGIDPSLTSTGVAVIKDGRLVHHNHHGRPGKNGASYQSRSRRIRRLAADVVNDVGRWKPDLAAIEQHPYAVGHQGNEFDRAGLWHGIFGQLDWLGIPTVVVHPSTHKVWLTGKGNSKKAEVVAAVQAMYPGQTITCDDEADAIGHALIGAFHLGEPMPFDVKPRHTTGLEKVQWPATA
ncbi:crossover junction endodeoxyribonuclease RuvC [Mycolicibacterium fluoranthenivorans]|uniref:Crossover junction endodeoxyribonuclease RuvC n=1 Tax=Mycolicibacterium fluoranthenivorans TaxID=258505 RepID=A0A7X5U466_9MYCO|nr:crossover junction endodeoxyribonuclease RuvC [Mycolicibacterium fluoranthenivorans]MCV7358501.1 hypothetical protein [Mycolicibacterium fluoranthenivorans]NIH98077.1 crossover junction endodeoxyribonuclease RuvC [Mycolicibacterium fluoranthenivorans]